MIKTIRQRYQESGMVIQTSGKLEAFFHESNGENMLTIFKGKAQKPFFNASFGNDWAKRDTRWNKIKTEHLQELHKKDAEQTLVKNMKKIWKNPYKIGDVFYTSWGYEQTNTDFYQCVEVNAKSLVLRAISSKIVKQDHHGLSGTKTYIKDSFHGEPFLARITFQKTLGQNNKLDTYIVNKKVCAFSSFGICNGETKNYSHWH